MINGKHIFSVKVICGCVIVISVVLIIAITLHNRNPDHHFDAEADPNSKEAIISSFELNNVTGNSLGFIFNKSDACYIIYIEIWRIE